MSNMAASLIAWGGVYVFVAVHTTTLALARPQQAEYRSFAGYAASLAMLCFAGACEWEATMPAEIAFPQSMAMIARFVGVVFFVQVILHLSGKTSPRFIWWTRFVAGVGVMLVTTRAFFDPAIAARGYDWSIGPTAGRAAMQVSPAGILMICLILGLCAYALFGFFDAARTRADIRFGAVLTAGTIVAGLVDLYLRVSNADTTIYVSTHGTLLSVLGFSYVLLGRFTAVDAELEHRTGELARSYDHRRLTQAQIVKNEQLAAVGELSAVIAHEVRNPLAIIKNAVAGLRRPELPPKDGETLLSILDEESDRLNKLIDDLLAYARPIEPGTARVDMPNLVGHAVELAASGNRDISHLELELELSTACAPIQGDQALLRHALINIVDNALQAMPNGGTLTVSCKDTVVDGVAHVAVEFHDTGEGMDTLVRTRARDPFFTTRDSGTGLGLAMVDRVARAHGGRVEIESRHGQGTTVCFVIPRDRAAD